MATNNPRKNRQRALQQSAKQAPIASEAHSDNFSSSDIGQISGSIAESADAPSSPRPASSDIPPITIPGAKSNKARLNATGSRPSVKQSKKVSSQKSEATDSNLAIVDESASVDKVDNASSSGTVLSDGESSISELENPAVLNEDDDAGGVSDTSGAEAAQAFRLEKQIEREQLAEKKHRIARRRRRIKILLGLFATILVAGVVAVCAAFSTFRWHTYDDAKDIQGTWNVSGTEAPMTITEDSIRLTEDVAYKYVIDPEAKTISFTFGNLEGHAHYRFSLDRNQLSITDGEFSWTDTLVDDAAWTIQALIDRLQGRADKAPAADVEGTILLERM